MHKRNVCVIRQWVVLCVAGVALLGVSVYAQQTCPPATALPVATGPNIFTPEQEQMLGDIMAEQFERNLRLMNDPELISYVQGIVERIAHQMPETKIRFRVSLIDSGEVNAVTFPGGRIYLMRKMVSFARNEDEIASVLAHEMGHTISRQGAVRVSHLFHDVLGITSVGDRHDIFEKYNQLLDNVMKNPKVYEQIAKQEEPNQYQADRVALYALANAGYSPQAFENLWDRLAGTHGQTGNFFTNLFGATTASQKRLHEIRKSLDEMPAACRISPTPSSTADFLKWQTAIVSYSGLGRPEVLPGLLAKNELQPPLVAQLDRLRFSPDGQYILAQDDANILVLSRNPFKLLFRIDAEDAHAAWFTPDSKTIVFYTPSLRVEQWSLADEERITLHEMAVPGGCMETALSRDGKILACYNRNFELKLIDVASGESTFTKNAYGEPSNIFEYYRFEFFRLLGLPWVYFRFSPDAHYFFAKHAGELFALDVSQHDTAKMSGLVKQLIENDGVFLAPDKIAGWTASDSKHLYVLTFPAGERITSAALDEWRNLDAPTQGSYLLLRSPSENHVSAYDLNAQKVVVTTPNSMALDLYDNVFLAQRSNGNLAFVDVNTRNSLAEFTLTRSPLGRLRAGAISPDFKWLVFSSSNRGGVWDLSQNRRMYYVRGFRGAYIDDNHAIYADFPKFREEKRAIVRLDLEKIETSDGIKPAENEICEQDGRFLIVKRLPEKGGPAKQMKFEVHDIRTDEVLWTRDVNEWPSVHVGPTVMTIAWKLDSKTAAAEIAADPDLRRQTASINDKRGSYLFDIIDSLTGKPSARIVLDTGKGSFYVTDARAVGNWLLITDSHKRTLLYLLPGGEKKGEVFGSRPFLDQSLGLLCVETRPGELTLFSLNGLEKRSVITFSSPIAMASFSGDGKKLFVLTRNQMTYLFDVSSAVAAHPPASTASR